LSHSAHFSQELRIVGIAGSVRPRGDKKLTATEAAVAVALEGAADVGAQTELLDLRELNLPLRDGLDFQSAHCEGSDVPEGVSRLRAAVAGAHGVILGTPEYHNSYSGAIKTAIDWLTFDEIQVCVP
jgi:NAD(P)H-dependent FMN reductase